MKKIILFSITILFFIGLTFVPNSFSAQSDYFLKLDGIEGSAIVLGESGWIQLYTVQYNESDLDFIAGISNSATQTENPRWTLSKPFDKSSPLLFEAIATGKQIKEGTLTLCSDGKCEYKILLSDISVIGFNSNSTAGVDTETIVLKASKIKENLPTVIPGWIKNNAKWFADGSIGESDFTKGIEYMIQQGIMKIPNLPTTPTDVAKTNVPDWVKNNAKWWSDGLITDDDFVKGIQYLVEKGIIRV